MKAGLAPVKQAMIAANPACAPMIAGIVASLISRNSGHAKSVSPAVPSSSIGLRPILSEMMPATGVAIISSASARLFSASAVACGM